MVETAFVGDVHGNLAALDSLVNALAGVGSPPAVFLGDYINKGSQSREVLARLIEHQESGWATLLAGNHEIEMLRALDTGDITAFLKMGGAVTIRSYVGSQVPADVAAAFRARVPSDHVAALRSMKSAFETSDVVAGHHPSADTEKFNVSAHVPVGARPRVTETSAEIDTGCGSGGPLTAFLWPGRTYLQVDTTGARLP